MSPQGVGGAGGRQIPGAVPLQWERPVKAPVGEHEAIPQLTVEAGTSQAPALQLPVSPQGAAPATHNGSGPEATGEQVPWLPWTLQAWQAPVQALLQQKPSTQLPFVHSVPTPQVAPLAFFGMQTPVDAPGV